MNALITNLEEPATPSQSIYFLTMFELHQEGLCYEVCPICLINCIVTFTRKGN